MAKVIITNQKNEHFIYNVNYTSTTETSEKQAVKRVDKALDNYTKNILISTGNFKLVSSVWVKIKDKFTAAIDSEDIAAVPLNNKVDVINALCCNPINRITEIMYSENDTYGGYNSSNEVISI